MNQTHAVVVSTLMEAWEVVRAGLAADSTVKDVSIEGHGAKTWDINVYRSCMVYQLQLTR